MLKFIKHHMDTISGIEVYPLISLLIFFVFFTVLLIWVMRADKGHLAEQAQLPLDGENEGPKA